MGCLGGGCAQWQGFAFSLPSRLAFGAPPTPLLAGDLDGKASPLVCRRGLPLARRRRPRCSVMPRTALRARHSTTLLVLVLAPSVLGVMEDVKRLFGASG